MQRKTRMYIILRNYSIHAKILQLFQIKLRSRHQLYQACVGVQTTNIRGGFGLLLHVHAALVLIMGEDFVGIVMTNHDRKHIIQKVCPSAMPLQ